MVNLGSISHWDLDLHGFSEAVAYTKDRIRKDMQLASTDIDYEMCDVKHSKSVSCSWRDR